MIPGSGHGPAARAPQADFCLSAVRSVVRQDSGGGGGLTCQSKTSGLPLKRLWQ